MTNTPPNSDLTLRNLGAANQARQDAWPGGAKIDLAFVGLEIGEEAGEVQGAVKKIIRHRDNIAGNKTKSEAELLQKFSDEAADLFINLSRMCNALGVDPDEIIRAKFNSKSREVGLNIYL